MSRQEKNRSAKKKWLIIAGILATLVVGIGLFIGKQFLGQSSSEAVMMDMPYMTSPVTEGSVASSTLLTGTVKALREEKIYYDAGKGPIAAVYVNVGDHVTVGQQLMQYSTTNAQAEYDQAVRGLNKIGRQIEELRVNGTAVQVPSDATSDDGAVLDSGLGQRSYQSQLQDLYDAYADAQQAVNKAQNALTQTLEVSAVEGTVVEVNTSVDPSKTGGQLVIHVVSEGQLQVEGALTEYDMANLAVDQEVKLTSKVFPDKTWDGRISYISNYPSDSASAPTAGGSSGSSSASYPFKVDFVGDTSSLKQGFKVTVEVVNPSQHKLIPVSALLPEADKQFVFVYHPETKQVNKVEVTIGRADAFNQEITGGLELGQIVISNPTPDLKDGQTLPEDKVIPLEQEAGHGQ